MSNKYERLLPKAEPSPLADAIMDAARKQLEEVYAHRDKYVKAWVDEHGLLPSQVVLVEKRMSDGSIRMWIEPKEGTL